MKIIILLAFIGFAAAGPFYALQNLDMDNMVKNVKELKELTSCLLDKTPCNAVYEDYRVRAWEAMHEACKRCSPHAKHMFWQYVNAMKALLPDQFEEFKKKYDPENKYFESTLVEINKYEKE